MPPTKYTYSTTTYPNLKLVDLGTLGDSISTTVSTNISSINNDSINVSIVFDDILSINDKTSLDNLINAVVPTRKSFTYTNVIIFVPDIREIYTPYYYRADSYLYSGNSKNGVIKHITVIGYVGEGTNNYSVRIYDKTNRVILAEGVFTNKEENHLHLTPLTTIPTKTAIIELHVKRESEFPTSYALLSSVKLYW